MEYRLLQHAPFPAAVQDAAAVYAHLARMYTQQGCCSTASSSQGASGSITVNGSPNPDSHSSKNEHFANPPLSLGYNESQEKTKGPFSYNAATKKACKIILIGDSAGGNLVLALARWIRDETKLPPPDGLLLLSPSCDPCKFRPRTRHRNGLLTSFATQPMLSPRHPHLTSLVHTRLQIILSIHLNPVHSCNALF